MKTPRKGGAFIWRSGWDSNPRTVARHLISSQGRYDHFDTPPRQESLYPRFAANVKACSGRGGDCAQDLTLGGNSDLSRAIARLKGDRSPFNTSPSDLPKPLRGSGRQICKEVFFTLVDRLPAAKIASFPPYMPPDSIEHRGAAAPDPPGKLAACPRRHCLP